MEDPYMGEIIRDVLRSGGHEVLSIHRADQASRLLAEETPAGLVLLDSRMTGGTFLEELRRRPVHARVPVILCTAYSAFVHPEVNATLRMPFTLEELLRIVALNLP